MERQLKIKYGVLKRIKKDLVYYQKEKKDQIVKIEKMRQDGKVDGLRQQEQVLEETETMLPDCHSRLAKAKEDLQLFVDEHKSEEGIEGSELLQDAENMLVEAA